MSAVRESVANKELNESRLQGFLWKQGHIVRNWKRRFFVLQNGVLSYAVQPNSAVVGTIQLRDYVVRESTAREHSIELVPARADSGKKHFLIAADQEEDIQQWTRVLRRTVQLAANPVPSPSSELRSSIEVPNLQLQDGSKQTDSVARGPSPVRMVETPKDYRFN